MTGLYSSRRTKNKQAGGVVTSCSSRIAKSGSQAHSFHIGSDRFTIFTSDELSPVTTGDRVRFDYEVRRLKSGYRNTYFAVIPETLVIEVPNDFEGEVEGVVYVFSNQSMPGLLKVGFTTGTATNRAAALSSVTSVPTGFKVEWSLPVIGNPRAVEQRAHALLSKHRSAKEFFRVSLEKAKEACIQSFAELYPERASAMDDAFAKRATDELARREELARQQVERETARKDEEARTAFENSREGRWLTRGSVRFVVQEFNTQPNRNHPSLFSKLFGQKFEDFLELKVSPHQRENDELIWTVHVNGRIAGQSVWETHTLVDQDACIRFARSYVKNRYVDNYRLWIEVSNIFIEQPPELPPNYGNPETALGIKDMDGLDIRPARIIYHRGGRKSFAR